MTEERTSGNRAQPVGQTRHTNIAVVRLKRNGKRFEIACYRNMVVNWRNGVETDLDEVLQTDVIFMNVAQVFYLVVFICHLIFELKERLHMIFCFHVQGRGSSEKDLKKAFGTIDEKTICEYILKHGTLQVSEGERAIQLQEYVFCLFSRGPS
jgi:ribosome maturation protein SDO1